MATIYITHFDQLGTICNDYLGEYRITGAYPNINNLPDTVLSRAFLFAADTKIYRHMQNIENHNVFQDDIFKPQEWVNK